MKATATAITALGILCIAAVLAAQQQVPQLPDPTPARPNFGSVVPRPANAQLKAPQGFTVDVYAENVPGARLMVYAPNGDLFVTQTAANMVSVFRDTNKDGLPDERFVYAEGAAARGAGGGRPRARRVRSRPRAGGSRRGRKAPSVARA